MSARIMRWAFGIGLALAVSACGVWQSVRDGTANVTRAVFETRVRQMNLVVTARNALNQDARGVSLPVVLRIYQLKDDRPFATATYTQLLDGNDELKAATVWSEDVTLGPGQIAKVSEQINGAANYVGVAAFFRDTASAEWSLLVPKSQWKKTDPVKLVAVDRSLEMDTKRDTKRDTERDTERR